ncbi:Receptor-like kinase LIP2 [Zea mays]|uniref:Receptor-like kinase LIP2 n=1 Tax=Zea mays TaxID=4577 RepID=A0A1D6I058_MAIZE|nr:Receptor-like kinase LIP2 [Zea mays]
MPWRWAAAAATRKLTGISQSRVSVAFTGRLLYRSFGSDSSESRKRSLPRGVVSIGAISLAGGLVLSAVNDLAIFNGCTTKAIEHAADNPAVVEAIGVPIVRGPWYDASLERMVCFRFCGITTGRSYCWRLILKHHQMMRTRESWLR